jgi:hypothetical protein
LGSFEKSPKPSVRMASPGGSPTGMSVDAFLGVGTALVVVTAVFVATRIIANIQTKRLLIDDGEFDRVYMYRCSIDDE